MPGGSRCSLRISSTFSRTPVEGLERVAAAAHQHDALDHVRVVVVADDAAGGWRGRSARGGDVADADRHAVLASAARRCVDVLGRLDQAEAAHVEGLLAERQDVAADVQVGVLRAPR